MSVSNLSIIEGAYFHDILAQPRALADTADWLAQSRRWDTVKSFVSARPWKRVVLTGMGSSLHVLQPLSLTLIEHGFTPILMETSELIYYARALLDRDTLVVVASQSGRSAEIVRLLSSKDRWQVLGITNTADSPLASYADCLLVTQAGTEATVSCKTYVAAMLALRWLGAIIAGRSEPQVLPEVFSTAQRVEGYLQRWRSHTQALAQELLGVRHLFLTGRGSSIAAACTGALVVKESTRLHAEAMSSAGFRHGPMEMLRDDMLTAVFTGDGLTAELNRRLVRDLIGHGGRSHEIGEASDCEPLRLPPADALLQPVLEILPIQMMTLALAALAGVEAGRFHLATKITAID